MNLFLQKNNKSFRSNNAKDKAVKRCVYRDKESMKNINRFATDLKYFNSLVRKSKKTKSLTFAEDQWLEHHDRYFNTIYR